MATDPKEPARSLDDLQDARTRATLVAVGASPVETPRTPKARATVAKLLTAGADVFGRLGYEKTRVADITAAAGVAHGSFYRYFADKDAILNAILAHAYAELNTATRAAGSGSRLASGTPPSREALIESMRVLNTRFFHEYAARRDLLRVAREAAASSSSTRFRDMWFLMRGGFVDRTERLVARLKKAGHASADLDNRLVAEALSAMTEQLAYVQIGLADQVPSSAEIDALGNACHIIWVRTLFTESGENA